MIPRTHVKREKRTDSWRVSSDLHRTLLHVQPRLFVWPLDWILLLGPGGVTSRFTTEGMINPVPESINSNSLPMKIISPETLDSHPRLTGLFFCKLGRVTHSDYEFLVSWLYLAWMISGTPSPYLPALTSFLLLLPNSSWALKGMA